MYADLNNDNRDLFSDPNGNNFYSDSAANNEHEFDQPNQFEVAIAPPKPKLTGDDSEPETEEELKLIAKAQNDQQERLRRLREKEDQETTDKRARKAQAQKELKEWYASK